MIRATVVMDDGLKPEDRSVAFRRWTEIARALDQRDVELTVATLRGRSGLHSALHAQGCRAIALGEGNRIAPIGAVGRLVAALRATPDCVIHGQEAVPAVIAASAGILMRNPRRIYHRYHVFSSPRHAKVSRMAGMLSARTIAVSRASADAARAYDKTAIERVSVAWNGVEPLRSAPLGEVSVLRERWRLGEGPVALCVSRLRREKGVDVLIGAAAALPSSVNILIVGSGPEESDLRRRAASPSDGARVVFTGHQSDIAPFYSMADIFVLPSRMDACPFTGAEAMSLGLPIVGSRVGGIPEMVAHESSGLLVRPDDPRGLAIAITALLGDEHRRKRLGAAGLDRYRERFSLDAMADAWARVYREVSVTNSFDE